MKQSVADKMHKLWLRNQRRTSFYDYRAERWFVRDLKLISPTLDVKWGKWIDRWIITDQGEPSHIVCNMDDTFRPLDQRILRKLRFDHFLTYNGDALEAYLDEDNYALQSYLDRGLEGVKDYLGMKAEFDNYGGLL